MKTLAILAIFLLTLFCAPLTAQKLSVDTGVAQSLEIFYQNMRSEFVFCAHGEVADGVIRVDSLTVPQIYYADENNAYYNPQSCVKERFLGMVHSHPGMEVCNFSVLDLYNFALRDNPFDFVYCSGRRLAWNDRTDFKKKTGPVFGPTGILATQKN